MQSKTKSMKRVGTAIAATIATVVSMAACDGRKNRAIDTRVDVPTPEAKLPEIPKADKTDLQNLGLPENPATVTIVSKKSGENGEVAYDLRLTREVYKDTIFVYEGKFEFPKGVAELKMVSPENMPDMKALVFSRDPDLGQLFVITLGPTDDGQLSEMEQMAFERKSDASDLSVSWSVKGGTLSAKEMREVDTLLSEKGLLPAKDGKPVNADEVKAAVEKVKAKRKPRPAPQPEP